MNRSIFHSKSSIKKLFRENNILLQTSFDCRTIPSTVRPILETMKPAVKLILEFSKQYKKNDYIIKERSAEIDRQLNCLVNWMIVYTV